MAQCVICGKELASGEAILFDFQGTPKPVCATCLTHLYNLRNRADKKAREQAHQYIYERVNEASDPDVLRTVNDMEVRPELVDAPQPGASRGKSFGSVLMGLLAWLVWICGVVALVCLASTVGNTMLKWYVLAGVAVGAFLLGGVLYALSELFGNVAALRRHAESIDRKLK